MLGAMDQRSGPNRQRATQDSACCPAVQMRLQQHAERVRASHKQKKDGCNDDINTEKGVVDDDVAEIEQVLQPMGRHQYVSSTPPTIRRQECWTPVITVISTKLGLNRHFQTLKVVGTAVVNRWNSQWISLEVQPNLPRASANKSIVLNKPPKFSPPGPFIFYL
ncbi:hypothetical protein RRG08_025192 [Elysia crispata]|uniref:Uncharacterized protein n=1 Tax=Elysia crispata TaxID=231223 RepID=A0AAE1AB48_9GAST|nr:hypothetical protein RRG08_025192 [Elysia crispata]